MAEYLIQDTTLDAIVEAINQKAGTQSAMTPAQMVTAIENIPSGGGGSVNISPASTTNNFPDTVAALRSAAYAVIGQNKPFIAMWIDGDAPYNYTSLLLDIPVAYDTNRLGQVAVARNGNTRIERILDYSQISTAFTYTCSANSIYKMIDLTQLFGGLIT